MVALGFATAIPVFFGLNFFHEDVDDVLAASVDESGDGATSCYIEAPTEQWESVVGKVADRRGEIDAAVEPGFDRVLIGGLDIGEMAGLQGAKMGIHKRCSHQLSIARAPTRLELPPADEHGEEQDSSDREPPPRGETSAGKRANSSLLFRIAQEADTQRFGSAFIETRLLNRTVQGLFRGKILFAIAARFEMFFEIGGAEGVEFAVEIPVQLGLSLLTRHGGPPLTQAEKGNCATGRARGPAPT